MALDNTRSRAQAAVSEADADVKRLESELSSAQTKLRLIEAGDSAVDKITSVPVIKDNTDFLRKRTESELASARADVDRIEADLASARSKLKWALKAQKAVDSVGDSMQDMKESAKAALDDTDEPDYPPPMGSNTDD